MYTNIALGIHCKNMIVVLTQLSCHSCNLRGKNDPHVIVIDP